MRAGLNTIQQTLTPEAAAVLNQAIAEASRRNHGQTTPLHVGAMLLASPSGFLRQACIRSHPNSSHPLQCRALELCFSVALERLPTAQNAVDAAPGTEPPISNALMAALKRAQAHQRRGCPEQQQQPLLAVKVELEQLIISILDDPSVSRVMREASFSSPAVKATIEQSLNNPSSRANQHQHHAAGGNANFVKGFGGIAPRILPNPGQLPTPGARPPSPAVPPLANRNLYLNPRLQQQQQTPTAQNGTSRGEEVKKVFDIMSKSKKRNPVLVGDTEPEAVAKELLGNDLTLKNVQIISIDKGLLLSDKNQIAEKINEFERIIESRIGKGGVILDLGDLRWLVEHPAAAGFGGALQQQKAPVVSESSRALVVEIAKLLTRFDGADSLNEGKNKLWLIGTATCETYLRCQVYHPTMESEWDLQAVPITSRSPIPGMFPRVGPERNMSNPLESLSPAKASPSPLPTLAIRIPENLDPSRKQPIPSVLPALARHIPERLDPVQIQPIPSSLPSLSRLVPENSDPAQRQPIPSPAPGLPRLIPENVGPAEKPTFCSQCLVNYEKDLAKLAAIGKSFSQAKQDAPRSTLPAWMQNAKLNAPDAKNTVESQGQGGGGLVSEQKTQELQKKWRDTCLHLHPNFHQTTHPENPGRPAMLLSLASIYNPNLLAPSPFQPIKAHPTKPVRSALQLDTQTATPTSPVRTDLVLSTKVPEKTAEDHPAKDLLSGISSEPQMNKLLEKFSDSLDAGTYKKLLKGLMENTWWQAEAASAVASAITRCRSGNGKQRGGGRGDAWLLFSGPDRVAKRKMASVLSEKLCGSGPVIICLGQQREEEELETGLRGRTAVDRIAEAVRRNPSSVIVLRDIDEADVIARGNIKRAIDRGRLTDSHGREVGLGNAVFIVTGDWSTVSAEALRDGQFIDERKLDSTAGGSWQLGLIVREKAAKRRASWSRDAGSRLRRPRFDIGIGGISLDLNLATAAYGEDGSGDSSEAAADETGPTDGGFSIVSLPHDLASCVDESVVFKPVEAASVRWEIRKTIAVKFSMEVDEKLPLEIGDDVLDKILGGLWHDRTSLEQWVERVVGPSFEELKPRLPAGDRSNSVVRLVVESDSCDRGKSKGNADWLPNTILV